MTVYSNFHDLLKRIKTATSGYSSSVDREAEKLLQEGYEAGVVLVAENEELRRLLTEIRVKNAVLSADIEAEQTLRARAELALELDDLDDLG